MSQRTIEAVAPDEFKYAMGVCMAAASMKGPYRNPENYSMGLHDEATGEVLDIRLVDNPMARGALAVRAQFDDSEKCVAIMLRISGVMDLIKDKRMQPYVRGDGDPLEIREEVLDVAAAEEMSAESGFDRELFFRNLSARIDAAEH